MLDLNELVVSTQNRIAYNLELAANAIKRGDYVEYERYVKNVEMMYADLQIAIKTGRPHLISDNAGW